MIFINKSNVVLTAVLLALYVVVFACSSGSTISSAPTTTAVSSGPSATSISRVDTARLGKILHKRVNQERIRQKLPTLRWDSALTRIAAAHSRDMASRNYFNHTSPEGQGLPQRFIKGHYACGITIKGVLHTGGESIARVPALPDVRSDAGKNDNNLFADRLIGEVIQQWLAAPTDRLNVLSPHWQREGVGISVSPAGILFVTVNFC
ncbi:MAG TPA: CAP domain-containing protein [Nitrospirota bacterium]|nr:CAP domain-containing protein [Nitrospirota bacterium]